MRYIFYDVAERVYKIPKSQIIELVKKHNLPKRKIWGCMAVEVGALEACLTPRAADGYEPPSESELWKAVEFARNKTGYYTRRR